jgi:hypothetical protein
MRTVSVELLNWHNEDCKCGVVKLA